MRDSFRAGLLKTSLVDFPGFLSAVLFLPGCNLRCPWCQNRKLVDPGAIKEEWNNLLGIEELLRFLTKRKKVLTGAVITGGEPSLDRDLSELISLVKDLGYLVKLDTNGTRPEVLKALYTSKTARPDYIAVDLKLMPKRYGELLPSDSNDSNTTDVVSALEETCAFLKDSEIAHEFRTLVLPGPQPGEKELIEMATLVDQSPWYFAPFKPAECLDPRWDSYEEVSAEEVLRMVHFAQSLGKQALPRLPYTA